MNLQLLIRMFVWFPLLKRYKMIFPYKEPYLYAGLNPKWKNPDGSQMTIKERKLLYKNWITA